MIYIVVIFLVVLSILLLVIIQNKNKEIRRIEYFISRITDHSSQTFLKSNTGSADFQKMIMSINKLIENQNKIKNEYDSNISSYKDILESIAHDFKTPATSILGYIELVGESKDKIDQDKYLNIIKTRTKELNRLIDDFFVLSILNTNNYPYKLEKIKPTDILTEQLFIYYEELDDKFEDIDVNLGKMGFMIVSDKRAVTRIFNNIIKNAFSHGTKCFKIDVKKENGYNISFENYVDLESSRITGIGMKIIRQFCDELDIKIFIENEDNRYKINLIFNGDDEDE